MIHMILLLKLCNRRKKALGLISLNQIGEIVCFNPFARERLRKVARLSMRVGRHLTDGPPLALSTSILHLFSTASDPVFKRVPCALEYTVSFLAKGLINCGSNAH